jgi:hypothetical protein
VTVATTPGAVYTGLAIGNPAVPRLFAANTSQNRVDVFDGAFGLSGMLRSRTRFNGETSILCAMMKLR